MPGNHDEGKGKGGSTFDPPSIVNERDAAARDKGCGGGVGGLAGDEYCAVSLKEPVGHTGQIVLLVRVPRLARYVPGWQGR